MYVSMCGAGLGFAVEWENVQQFPQIKNKLKEKFYSCVVDSKEGWQMLLSLELTAGLTEKYKIDYP